MSDPIFPGLLGMDRHALSHQHTDDQGNVWQFGNIPFAPRLSWQEFGSTPQTRLIPRSEWKSILQGQDLSVRDIWGHPIANQQSVGMCNAAATATAIEKARARQGLPRIQLSGGDLYHRIAVGGQDNGSLLEDGLREAMHNGVASTDVVPYMDWTNNYGDLAVQSRKKYRVLEALLCPTFDHAFSAALMGFPLIIGIMWYDNFRVDSRGWLPLRGEGGRGGHAFCGDKPVYDGDVYGIACPNSWTTKWGAEGRFVMAQHLFGREITGCWAVTSVVTEDGDVPVPKI